MLSCNLQIGLLNQLYKGRHVPGDTFMIRLFTKMTQVYNTCQLQSPRARDWYIQAGIFISHILSIVVDSV